MKRIVLLFLLALALPMAAFASNSFDFTNAGGTLSGSSAGLTLSGSTLIAMGNGGMPITGDLGTLTFSTAALSSGDLQQGATFSAGGAFSGAASGLGFGLNQATSRAPIDGLAGGGGGGA